MLKWLFMYVQFPNANFMKNTLFANNKTLNMYSVFLDLILGYKLKTNTVMNNIFSLMLLFFMHSKQMAGQV